MTEHMDARERHAHFRKEYACGGREPPKPHGRGAERKGKKAETWDRELGRNAVRSKD